MVYHRSKCVVGQTSVSTSVSDLEEMKVLILDLTLALDLVAYFLVLISGEVLGADLAEELSLRQEVELLALNQEGKPIPKK